MPVWNVSCASHINPRCSIAKSANRTGNVARCRACVQLCVDLVQLCVELLRQCVDLLQLSVDFLQLSVDFLQLCGALMAVQCRAVYEEFCSRKCVPANGQCNHLGWPDWLVCGFQVDKQQIECEKACLVCLLVCSAQRIECTGHTVECSHAHSDCNFACII